jgi:predicted Fe-Mo cluster-binding NifX family protein
MKICFPVTSNDGLESRIYDHFGSAPMFLIIDTEKNETIEQANKDLGHANGRCKPMKAIAGKDVDAIVVGGIGKGALSGLLQSGLKVFLAESGTVAKNLAAIQSGELSEMTPEMTCAGHSHGHGHGHAHGSQHEFGCGF